MINKKFFSISLVTAALAGSVALYSCKDDPVADTPDKAGIKAAQELCDCFSKATTPEAGKACVDAVGDKKSKFTTSDDGAAFEAAYLVQVASCTNSGYTGYFTALGRFAAETLCDCFVAAAGNQVAESACMTGQMSMPTYIQYDQVFGAAFTEGLMERYADVPDWFWAMWASGE